MAVALAVPVQALTLNEMGGSLDACFEPSADMGVLEAKLVAQGWVPVSGDALTDEIVDHMAWSLVVYDVGGNAAAEAVATARIARAKTVRDVLGAGDGTTMAMTRRVGRDSETVLVTRAAGAGGVTQACRFSLSPRSAFGHAATAFAEPNEFDLGSAEDPRKTTVILFNLARLDAMLDAPVPVSATVEATKTFPAP